ncbi:uncharacterized protein LOC121670657 [Corvus kubaryi]|uniref:uncharacterized protein LOC121670657 n=1 Tax=Corvus kubaryi TaxID=68294 RepID=UPI001C058EC4|nr:uncharacterized protein LOC121670657 [Corvus kubaryi]
MVRYIHRWLTANESGEHKLDNILLELTDAQPTDVVMTLLRVAPSCDRAATTMWSTILSSRRTARLVVLILLEVLRNWPEHIPHTSDGDSTNVFALAVSFWNWPFLALQVASQAALHPLPTLHLPASGAGLKPGLGAGSEAPGPVFRLHLPWPLPSMLWPCHRDTLGTESQGDLSFAGNPGDVEDPPGALLATRSDGVFPSLLCVSALPSVLHDRTFATEG